MPKKLLSKLCPFCNTPIIGKKRNDRNAYRYAPRCPDCAYKALTKSVIETKKAVLSRIRVQLPVGTKKLRKARDGSIYVRIKIAEPNEWEYEHRVVTNAPKGLHVHHKNGNTQDNRIENLVVITPSAHRKEHALQQWSKKYMCCVACGTTEKRHLSFGLCTTCYQRANKPQQ